MNKELEKAARELFRPRPVIHIKSEVLNVEEKPMHLDTSVQKLAIQHNEVQQQILRVSIKKEKLQHS